MNISFRLKKILVLGMAVIGVVFLNKLLISNRPESRTGFAVQPLSKGFSLAESGVGYDFYKDALKSFPPPDKFRPFNLNDDPLSVTGECSDFYYTIIIYEESVDYRENPSGAKFNQAFECPFGKKFSHSLILKNKIFKPGRYYLIVADQGRENSWYNPR